MRSQLAAINLADPSKIRGFSQTHQQGSAPNYNFEPKGCISPDGDMMLWTVGWQGASQFADFVAGVGLG
jgi:hypothetical protein